MISRDASYLFEDVFRNVKDLIEVEKVEEIKGKVHFEIIVPIEHLTDVLLNILDNTPEGTESMWYEICPFNISGSMAIIYGNIPFYLPSR